MYWIFISPIMKRSIHQRFSKEQTKEIQKNAKDEYQRLLEKAEDIGAKNPMAGNLYMSLFFLSFHPGNRELIDEQLLGELITEFLKNKIITKFIQQGDYNTEKDLEKFAKTMHRNAQWTQNHKDLYPNTWDFHFDRNLHQDGFYYHFTKCPIASFCKENNLEHLTYLFCEMDHTMFGYRHANLFRDHTIADGSKLCDFWVVGDQIKNPK